eukprot:TRINITY_DN2057_c0_g1_i1.p3 TRINITY_DN2057_c0_g1~~TRINITY_DN2057_c0_g1_i1.p3  ORF type:complete len:270 (-),score=-118.12 TRINITY_DN2057_c0_g1_i1:5190-5999(-)
MYNLLIVSLTLMSVFYVFNLVTVVYADVASDWQMLFQDPATPVMEEIISLHHEVFFFLIVITIFVCWMLFRTVSMFKYTNNPVPATFTHNALIEFIWTLIPAGVLLVIAIPSFSLLYMADEVIEPALTIKAIGHQWYWSYEYSDYNSADEEGIEFDSYMVPEDELEPGNLRLLEVDNRVVVPVNTPIRVVITSEDVLHSWAVPSLGVKIDAVPGRLSQVSMFIKREGVYYGQCSEICGVNHGFMPIAVEAVSLDNYVNWVSEKLEEANE